MHAVDHQSFVFMLNLPPCPGRLSSPSWSNRPRHSPVTAEAACATALPKQQQLL